MTSGSTYVVGGAPRPKSRGGVVTVLDGVTGPGGGACASAARGVKVAAPAGLTVTLAEPVALVVTVSLTATVREPAVLRVMALAKVWTPLSAAVKV